MYVNINKPTYNSLVHISEWIITETVGSGNHPFRRDKRPPADMIRGKRYRHLPRPGIRDSGFSSYHSHTWRPLATSYRGSRSFWLLFWKWTENSDMRFSSEKLSHLLFFSIYVLQIVLYCISQLLLRRLYPFLLLSPLTWGAFYSCDTF